MHQVLHGLHASGGYRQEIGKQIQTLLPTGVYAMQWTKGEWLVVRRVCLWIEVSESLRR